MKKNNVSLRVLFVSEYFWPRKAGGEIWSWDLCKSLAKKGLDITVLTSQQEGLPAEETRANVKILRRGVTGASLFQRWSWQKYISFEIRQLLREKAFDIVHAMAHAANVPASRLARKYGVASVTSVHSYMGSAWKYLKPWPMSALYTVLERRIIKRDRADVLQVPSWFLEALIKQEAGEECTVIPNFLPATPQKNPLSAKVKHAAKQMSKGKHILMVGSLLKVKNIPLAIKAVATIDATLWIAGFGPEEVRLKALAKKEAGKKVKFLGEIERHEARVLMSKADAVAVTSHNESFSLVALEAVAEGACLIGTPVGIVPELIHEDWQIINDVDTLAFAMDKARRKTPTNMPAYDKEKIVTAFIGLYKRLVCRQKE